MGVCASGNGLPRTRSGAYRITVTKEREDEPLGLSFYRDWRGKGLVVHEIGEGGCLARWNLENPDKKVVKYDLILSVNGFSTTKREEWENVREECRKDTVELVVVLSIVHSFYAKEDARNSQHCIFPRDLPTDLKEAGCQCTECAICLDTLDNDDKSRPLVVLPCGHAFHKDCGMSWLQKSANWPALCPVCRKEMPGERCEVRDI